MDCIIRGVTKSQTRLNDFHGEGNGNPLPYSCLENSMDKGGLQSMGSQRVRHD